MRRLISIWTYATPVVMLSALIVWMLQSEAGTDALEIIGGAIALLFVFAALPAASGGGGSIGRRLHQGQDFNPANGQPIVGNMDVNGNQWGFNDRDPWKH